MGQTVYLNEATFVVVDIETTGGVAGKHGITEIGAVKIQAGEIVDRFSTLVNPQQEIPLFIQQMTGITPDLVADAPTIDMVMPGFWDFLGEAIFVAHNVSFDFRFLDAVTRSQLSSGLDNLKLCTCRLARKLLPELKKKNLGSVASHFGITIKDRHRALGDADATALVLLEYFKLLADRKITTWAALQAFEQRGQKHYGNLVMPFPEHTLSQFPQNPGVYMMHDQRGDLLYIGKAKNLRKRLQSYYANYTRLPGKVQELIPQVHDIQVHILGSELEALLEESYLIKKHQPYYNRQIKNYQKYPFLKITSAEVYPKLAVTDDIEQDNALYFGPYARKSVLKRLMETLGKVFQLRTCTDGEFKKYKKLNQACVMFDLGHCSGPCAGKVSMGEYAEQVEQLVSFMEGNAASASDQLIAQRDRLAEDLDFEQAQIVQARLLSLLRMQANTQYLSQAVHQNHLVIVLPDRESPRNLILYVLKGRPVYKQVFDPRMDALESIFDRVQLLQHMLAMSATDKREVIQKIELSEIRIIAHWLKFLQPDPHAHIFHLTESYDKLITALTKHFMPAQSYQMVSPALTELTVVEEYEREVIIE